MGLVQLYVAAASATIGTNLMDGNWAEEDSLPRRVTRLGVVGHDVAGEMILQLYYGKFKVGEFGVGRAAAAAVLDDDMVVVTSKRVCRRGEPISLVVKGENCTTNAIHVVMDVKDIVRGGRRRRRGFRRFRRRW